jgi:ssDNA-binding Zn-finger/Zn-ribbon topoisomerase 1
MTETKRPYASYSIEDLEALFAAQGENVSFLSQLVVELSSRKTRRARLLLALAARNLAESEFAGDDSLEADSPNIETMYEDDFRSRQHEVTDAVANNGSGNRDRSKQNSPNSDQPPDDRRRPERLSSIRPLGTLGLPEPWVRPLNADRPLNIPPGADLPNVYIAALAALIDEIKKTGAGQKRYEVENGVRARGNECVYEFSFSDEADLFEDAKVEVDVLGRRIDGSIVSIGSGRLWLATSEELGPTLKRAVLLVDATALLEALKQRVEDVSKGAINFNRTIADAVVGKQPPPPDPPSIPEAPWSSDGGLDPAQSKAWQKALIASVTYVWGPPGCGKTRVLSEIVHSAFDAGKRILICSNTNKAVDQVLYRICRTLGTQHKAMDEGRIVRLGRIADEKLASEYHAFVTVDGIVERRSAELKTRLTRVQAEIADIDERSAHARVIIDRFNDLDNAQKAVDLHVDATNKIARAGSQLTTDLQSVVDRLRELDDELHQRRAAFFALFKRSEERIQSDMAAAQTLRTKIASEIDGSKAQYATAKAKYEAAKSGRDRLHAQLDRLDRSAAERVIAMADKSRSPFVAELREIESKISELRSAVLKDAKVLGATCTKAYLAVKEIGQVDMVIIDEASMVILPMLWFAAGLAKERVIVCGDFCQIPPIVQTSQQAVFDVLGHDVFYAAGLNDPRVPDDRRAMLETQYRMDESICALISEPMYWGMLRTATKTIKNEPPAPYDGALTIVDTSDLWPFESVNAFFSRFNLMHALLVRNLAWYFQGQGYIKGGDDLAVCTPYAAQSRLISKLIEGEGLEKLVQVGTVHSFQGDERNTIVLEFPEGYGGGRMLGQFLQGVPPQHVGARLINVAVSRAKNHLIVLANLTYLDRLLPSASLLRGILYDMQRTGRIVKGAALLAMRPIERDLRGLSDRVPLDIDAKTIGVFNQSTFDAAVETDIANAKESVVIFSGFVTPNRVAKLGDLLRTKTAGGVRVRCVTRPPNRNGTMDPALSKSALDALEHIDCVVDCRARIHEKVVLIDREIVWHGSLNVLSHTHLTDESMTRVVNAGLAEAIAANMSKRRMSTDKALQTIGDAENPRCEDCGSRTVYNQGKFGPFFYCEDECGWSVNLKELARHGRKRTSADSGENLPKQGPPCPLCKGKTLLRNGRNGPFFGCIKYPDCKGTTDIAPRGHRGRSSGDAAKESTR